ncbi:hypothetical protein EYF80_032308 [Liparis tanakae]|uniref:Uncharacterized protein n=1 Tax=Liparis tanakae TaxID=230148 RepID=A0A4Z2GY08_9TELE|nr:hypothetical protein EYF80_032308 [Liparis tanakae]
MCRSHPHLADKQDLPLRIMQVTQMLNSNINKTTETFDPKQAVDLQMKSNRRTNQGQGGASSSSSSSTMQEAEAEDRGGDTEEDSEEDCTY